VTRSISASVVIAEQVHRRVVYIVAFVGLLAPRLPARSDFNLARMAARGKGKVHLLAGWLAGRDLGRRCTTEAQVASLQ